MMTIEFFSSRPFLLHNHLAANDHVAFCSVVLVPGVWFLRGAGLLIYQRKRNTLLFILCYLFVKEKSYLPKPAVSSRLSRSLLPRIQNEKQKLPARLCQSQHLMRVREWVTLPCSHICLSLCTLLAPESQEKAAACQMSFTTPPETLQRVEESICLLSLERFASREGLVGPVLLNISMLLSLLRAWLPF